MESPEKLAATEGKLVSAFAKQAGELQQHIDALHPQGASVNLDRVARILENMAQGEISRSEWSVELQTLWKEWIGAIFRFVGNVSNFLSASDEVVFWRGVTQKMDSLNDVKQDYRTSAKIFWKHLVMIHEITDAASKLRDTDYVAMPLKISRSIGELRVICAELVTQYPDEISFVQCEAHLDSAVELLRKFDKYIQMMNVYWQGCTTFADLLWTMNLQV